MAEQTGRNKSVRRECKPPQRLAHEGLDVHCPRKRPPQTSIA